MSKLPQIFAEQFAFEPTADQQEFINQICEFILDDAQKMFLLKGYAGTGKTSLVSTLVKLLPQIKMKSVLMAPTGRAAKVIGNYADRKAFTIHSKIYRQKHDKAGKMSLVLNYNMHEDTLFIVDEASMISNTASTTSGFGSRHVLNDLLDYVFAGNNCKLLLIGDLAQLPPVKLLVSPALDENYLRNIDMFLKSVTIREVVRQSLDSGILQNATLIRKHLQQKDYSHPRFDVENFEDVQAVRSQDLEEVLDNSYSKYGFENTMVITRSNKTANKYNQQIRARIRYIEDELIAGDFMMVVKNNYHWLKENKENNLIANGDIIEVLKVRQTEEAYGFRFANALVSMVDYPDAEPIQVKMLLDVINDDAASIASSRMKEFFDQLIAEQEHLKTWKKKLDAVKENPFYNALQVKFAYAITCHKSQGGQWDCVIVDKGYVPDDSVDVSYLRWLYTAITRAKKQLYLVGF